MFCLRCTLLQTGALGDPDDARSLSGEGSIVSVAMMLSVLGVLALAVFLFVTEVVVRNAKEFYEAQQRAKWAGCTIEPPTTSWAGEKSYACFLSHYKAEAASDARFMHDMLAKMLRYPVFLDSANLVDLRKLLTDGVADSDVLLVLATRGVLTRPWCLLEIMHASKLKLPTIFVEIQNGGFDAQEMLGFIDDLENVIGEGLETLHQNIGNDLTPLKAAVKASLVKHMSGTSRLTWNPNASDHELIASLKDIIEAMALASDYTLKWTGDLQVDLEAQKQRATKAMETDATAAIHIVCRCDEALNVARMLQTEMAMKMGRLVTTAMPDSIEGDKNAESVALLLTKEVLMDPKVLASVFRAVKEGKHIVPICLIGRGYDHRLAAQHLSNLADSLGTASVQELLQLVQAILNDNGTAPTIINVQTALMATIPRIISVNWEPEGGRNQLEATVNTVMARIKQQPLVPGIKIKNVNKRGVTKDLTSPKVRQLMNGKQGPSLINRSATKTSKQSMGPPVVV